MSLVDDFFLRNLLALLNLPTVGSDWPGVFNPCPAEPGYTLPLQTV